MEETICVKKALACAYKKNLSPGWIQDHRVASIEPALDLAARAWLTHKAANGTAAEQGEINANFPNINAATSQADARSHGAPITFVAPAGPVSARLLTICALDYVEDLN